MGEPSDPTDRNGDLDGDGDTHLEGHLHHLAPSARPFCGLSDPALGRAPRTGPVTGPARAGERGAGAEVAAPAAAPGAGPR